MRSLSHILSRNQIDSDVHVAHSDAHLGGSAGTRYRSLSLSDLASGTGRSLAVQVEKKRCSARGIGQDVQLTSCRLDGDTCCQFSVVSKRNDSHDPAQLHDPNLHHDTGQQHSLSSAPTK